MGKQKRVMQRMAAVGAGVMLAGSLWTGSAVAQTSASGGPQCTLIPLLQQQANQLGLGLPALPLPGVPTDYNAVLNLLQSLIPGCSSSGGTGATSVQNPPYAPHNPKPYGCYPGYTEGYPDHPNFDDKFYRGGSSSAPVAPAGSSSGSSSNPAGLSGLPSLPGLGTDAATGQGVGVPAAAPAAAPQQQAAAPQAYSAQPQQAYVAGGQQAAGYGYQQGYQQQPNWTDGSGAQNMYGATPYGSQPQYDASYGGGFYGGPPPAYGDDYGYGHDGYKKDKRKGCYDKGKESSPKSYGKDDHGKDYGQVSHVPDGSVNTGDGSTLLSVVGRTTG